ncbi:MAG: DNA-deoxyinosine glycosylase [bacterium]|nr:DNA-deoxyinosine glycosylase [bacterium]
MQQYQTLHHVVNPVYDKDSRVLILGTFPSVKSREMRFFYGHPQNRFWKVLAHVMKESVPVSVEEKKAFLLRSHIAVWDVIESCQIIGSSDASIRDVVPTDLTEILNTARIRQIYVNGGKAYELYQKYSFPVTKREAVKLPSTSPANASWSFDRLCGAWGCIAEKLQDDNMQQRTR